MKTGEPALITEAMRAWIGRKSELEPLEPLGASEVRRYVDATGDSNPLWLDDAFARAAGYRGCLLPPTLVGWVPFSLKEGASKKEGTSYDLRRQVPVPEHYTNVRNAGSETEWVQAVYWDEPLYSQTRIADIVAREGKRGVGIYITQEEQILNEKRDVVLRRLHTIALFPEESLDKKGNG